MYSLTQSRRIRGAAGDPLEMPFKALEAKGCKLVRGQLVLIAAGPGTGKSALTLALALLSGVPTMYFSADSDAFTQLVRSICILTGKTTEEATALVLSDSASAVDERLAESPVRFSYHASPSLEDIETSMQAYAEVYGDFPALVIVDNVTNVRSGTDDGDPFGGLEALMDYLHTMARNTGACVVGLHHVTGAFNDADKPIPLSGVKGQITRVPEMVLTLHRPEETRLGVSVVKNRGGKADPSGQDFAELIFEGSTMQFSDTF